ncbi:4a-hydroxytetrahydrobiopterin dehydratase [Prochlorococcus sp. MIT 1341]|uniref:4a-hydroxytetrahydrobiopterin dehydratase n=1 Tax=Prochlorococcus sp. MIT 1341 TaxID=3096221 RepID=UPI002A74A144|nr:4a-hydroxytetrahydrobiopterin dehydratase [Prochlorococcus sp. MIT 1341]
MDNWQHRNRPNRLERRFDFDSYGLTRDFLDQLGELSEASGIFPDISFGKTYVNITLRPESEEEGADLTSKDYKFASDIDGLFN